MPLRVGKQIPQAVSPKLFTCPYLSTSVLSYLPLKKLFIPFYPIVIWLALRGPSTLRAPYRLLFTLSLTIFLSSKTQIRRLRRRKSIIRPVRKSTVWSRNQIQRLLVKVSHLCERRQRYI
jgi:hypothetical protein